MFCFIFILFYIIFMFMLLSFVSDSVTCQALHKHNTQTENTVKARTPACLEVFWSY